jgi:type VII secretion protein EccB
MASRRDLVQSFQFAARRVVSAAVMRRTDPTEWPYRRLGGAGLGAVMVTVIALAAAGIYGVVVPGGKTSWKDGRTVIVVKETGASYVYIEGKLHPVLNFTSAALIVGTTEVTVTASTSLKDVPRGVELGIPDAPVTLPKDPDLVSPPWSLCSQQVPDETGTEVSRTRLVLSRAPGRGDHPGDKALLVTDTADNSLWLIWHDLRFPLVEPDVLRVAMRLDNNVHVPVGDAWLKALPSGQPIQPINMRDTGKPSTAITNTKVGQVLMVQTQDRGSQYYLVEPTVLRAISELQAQIQHAKGTAPVPMAPDVVAAAPKASVQETSLTTPPPTVPEFVRPARSETVLCAAYQNGSFAPVVLVDSAIPAGNGVPTTGLAPNGTPLANRIWVPPGRGALVESLPSPSAASGPLFLVTDQGKRYAIPDSQIQRALGFTNEHIAKLPASLVVRIPEGPPLDPAAARAALQEEKIQN